MLADTASEDAPVNRCLPRVVATFVLALAAVSSVAAAAGPAKPGKPAARAVKFDPRAEQYCAALHRVPAERRQACCGRPVANLAAQCASELSAALARGTVALDEAAVARCASDSASAFEGCAWITPLQPAPPESCAGLVRGALDAGSTCRSSLECGDGLHCRGLTPSTAGVCRPAAAARQRCEFPADNLANYARAQADPRHAVCAGACLKGQCLEPVAEGGACPSTAACMSGLNCQSGTCTTRAPPALGDSCAAGRPCLGDAVCVDGTCAARKDTGASCRLPFECRSLACEKRPGSETGTCADVCSTP